MPSTPGAAQPSPSDLPDVLAIWPPAVVAGDRSSLVTIFLERDCGCRCAVLAMLGDDLLAEVEVHETSTAR
jgi:hypothetical protein